jgi:hypothetical protein
MKELVIEAIVQYAKEQYPEARPRIISDNGPQFIANSTKRPKGDFLVLPSEHRRIDHGNATWI